MTGSASPSVVVPQGRAALARVLPFFLFVFVLAIRGALDSGAPASVDFADPRWLYLLQALAGLAALLAFRAHYGELARTALVPQAMLLSVGAGLCMFLLWIQPMPAWMHLTASAASFVPLDHDGGLRWDLVAIRSFGAVLVVPIMEELFWRSFLMRWIDQRNFLALPPAAASWTAVAVSCAVFSLAHELWLAAAIAGFVYALLYRRFGNLWYPILAHATTNLALAVWVVSERAWAYW